MILLQQRSVAKVNIPAATVTYNTTSRIGFRKFNVLRRNSILYFCWRPQTNKENENICVIHGNPENRRSKPLLINRTQDWILRPCPVQSFFWKMGSQHIHIRFFSSFENWPRIDVNGCHVKFKISTRYFSTMRRLSSWTFKLCKGYSLKMLTEEISTCH